MTTQERFRAHVRLVANIQNAATAKPVPSPLVPHPPPRPLSSPRVLHPPPRPSHQPGLHHATAEELYARFNTQGLGLDIGQAAAALEDNGVSESADLVEGVFATCDVDGSGSLGLAEFKQFVSVVSMRTRQRDRQRLVSNLKTARGGEDL